MDWILASASPRRKELLAQVIEKFDILPSGAEERIEGKPSPETLVKMLAAQKAAEVANRAGLENKAVLGADTIVTIDGEILGKPKDEADAFRMLKALSGRAHEVYTGVCMLFPKTEKGREERLAAACTKVYFYPLSDEQIRAYIATGSPMDKAGAYGIQDGGLVEKIEGSFSNVVGLPVELCKEMLRAND
ncbi:MAG: septum formation protein Maf [Clostridia bacterium]|nr:septum formation protein Maf [Clostridia bacterium]